MTQAVREVFLEQKPEHILSQLEKNLRDAKSVCRLQIEADRWIRELHEGDTSRFVQTINRELAPLLSEPMRTEDIVGAEVYPDEETAFAFEQKHGLSPLSFGLAIPADRWQRIQTIFGMSLRSMSIGFSDCGISEYGFDKSGFTMYEARQGTNLSEYNLLNEDILHYSLSQRNLAAFILQKASSPWQLGMALLHRIKRDMCADRYDGKPKRRKTRSLVETLAIYGSQYERAFERRGATPTDIANFRQFYSTVTSVIVNEIPIALDALAALEERLGPAYVTPLLYALGAVEEHYHVRSFYSPIDGIIKAEEYVASGKLQERDFRRILDRKGYKQMAFA